MTEEIAETQIEPQFLKSINKANGLLGQVGKADNFNMRIATDDIRTFFKSEEGKTLMEQVNEKSRQFLEGESIDEIIEKTREKAIADTMLGKPSVTSSFGEKGVFLEVFQELSKAIGEEPLSAEDLALKKFADNYALYQVRPFFFASVPTLMT